ncbi:hypothetical protein IW261DRAFT_838719 [Armillaria novae-zelandiae]|uniref:Uncharacterized protein n=1 Tax=Armillaria novae-zelandiae TaxID=153914 RepID=A0AA39UCS9_9AGAR|nr:hypothetical protein IW261DRAFT_838719 [Armillaria novae-zelandiae]
MIPFHWLTRIVSSFYHFIMPPPPSNDDMCIFTDEPHLVLSASGLLKNLKNRNDFLREGLGNIHVERVEYRKSRKPRSPLEHEYLVVTVKESSGAERRGYLLVDRLNDDPSADVVQICAQSEVADSGSSSPAASSPPAPPPDDQWETTNRLHRAGARLKSFSKFKAPSALDRVVILRSIADAATVQDHCPYYVLRTMDLSQVRRRITLEDFLLVVRTTSENTKQYHVIFAQCYWFAFTIWTVVQLVTLADVTCTKLSERQGKLSSVPQGLLPVGRGYGVNDSRTPRTIKLQWEAAKVEADQEWAALQQAHRAPALAREAAEQALQQERAAREQDQAALQQERAAREQDQAALQQERTARRQAEAASQAALEQERAARLRIEAEANELRAMLQLQHRPGNV